jgi:hypothetical protein
MEYKKFLELDKRGLIPGPGESPMDFAERAQYCIDLESTIEQSLEGKVPFSEEDAHAPDLGSAFERTESHYGIKPDWVPIYFSNAHLTPWHGGCAWIFQMDENSPTSAFLQVRKQFRSSDRYLGWLKRDEVLAHELAHVGRMTFEEPKFEEFLAYQSSSSSWRRWFGPILQATWESLLFVGVLLMILIVDIFLFWYGDLDSYLKLMWLKLIPLGMIGAGVVRLIIRHQQLKKCRQSLSSLTPNPLTINAIIYRLTDEEIIAFGKMDKKALIDYMKREEENALRWRVITRGYLHECFINAKPGD